MAKRGRPVGHRLSEETKDKIRRTSMGRRHSIETKDRISKGLLKFFRRKNTLSGELMGMYGSTCSGWITSNQEDLDASECITLSRMRSMNFTEFPAGNVIEEIAVNDLDPETLILLKEEIERKERN